MKVERLCMESDTAQENKAKKKQTREGREMDQLKNTGKVINGSVGVRA